MLAGYDPRQNDSSADTSQSANGFWERPFDKVVPLSAVAKLTVTF
jgi:hypothetical protein